MDHCAPYPEPGGSRQCKELEQSDSMVSHRDGRRDPERGESYESNEYDSLGLLIDGNGLKAFHSSAAHPDDAMAEPLPACRDCSISDVPIVEILRKTERWHLKRSAFNFEGDDAFSSSPTSSDRLCFAGSMILGEGSVGTVMKAKLNGNPVAVKILREDLKSSMQHLKDLIQVRLSCPTIVG